MSEEKLVKHVIASQEKVDRFRFLKLKVNGLMRKVRQDMRQIKSIVNKEKRRKDSCLSENTSGEDCADLDALEEKLSEEEQRLQLEFTAAVRSSKSVSNAIPAAIRARQSLRQTSGKLVKLPLLGL